LWPGFDFAAKECCTEMLFLCVSGIWSCVL